MNKSIETIWSQGFINEQALVAPKVNDLYNQKSQNLVDKFERMFASNQKGVLIGAAVIFAVLAVFGAPILGLIIAAMLLGLVMVGKKQLTGLQSINKGVSSYEYLKSFDAWLDDAIAQYTNIYRYFYPSLFLLCAIRFLVSDFGSSIASQFPAELVISGAPIPISLLIVLVTVMLSILGGRVYQADVNMVYGKQIQKLKELIADMEALRK